MKKCCVDTAYRVEEDYRKRVKDLEAAMKEFRNDVLLANDQRDMANIAATFDKKFEELLK